MTRPTSGTNTGTLICDYVPWCRCLKCDPTSASRYCGSCGGEIGDDYDNCICPEPDEYYELYEEESEENP